MSKEPQTEPQIEPETASKKTPQADEKTASPPSAAAATEDKAGSNATSAKSTTSSTAKSTPNQQSRGHTTSSGKPVQKTKMSKSIWFVILLLLIVQAGLVAGGYFAWKEWQAEQAQQRESKTATQQLFAQQQKIQQHVEQLQQQQSSSINEVDTVIGSLRAELTAVTQRQDSHNRRLLSLANTSREDWLLAEAEYLLRLANQRLLIEKDTRAAQGMVEAADAILLELDQVDLYPLRKSLASDLVKLKLASKIDKEQMYLRLQALSDNIQVLPLLMEMQRQRAVVDMQQASDTEEVVQPASLQEKIAHWFTSSLEKSWAKINSYIRVREHSKSLEPLLAPESDLFLRQNLRFLLSHAQLAMLQEQPLIYQQSLNQAQQWLRDYYQLSEPAQNFIAELQELAELNIVQQVPDISTSSRELQVYIERLHKIGEGGSKNSAAEAQQ